MLIQDKQSLSRIIQEAADSLDVPDHVYEYAVLKYEDVAGHLCEDGCNLVSLDPQIYSQGSFRLGTVVSPYHGEDEYDIDLVCRLDLQKESTSQADLKKRVGDRLKERSDLGAVLEESRRCWRINYPVAQGEPKFHLDVLPAIPTEIRDSDGIYITDKDLFRWQYSNPVSYADWFIQQMKVVFEQKRVALAEAMAANVEDVPTWQVKTPLQRSIQILKRHRDIFFEGDPDDRPISIIITTLAAKAYRNEADIYDALTSIVDRMPSFVENRNGTWWVANPVEPNENFADKWNEYPSRKTAFENWLLQVRQDFAEVARTKSEAEGRIVLSEKLGGRQTGGTSIVRLAETKATLPVVPPIGSTTHVVRPDSVFTLREIPAITARLGAELYFRKKGKPAWLVKSDSPIPKGYHLKLSLKTNATGSYTVRWQVVNTGDEAKSSNCLRGDFYDSDPGTRNTRWESTAYRGTHWVEAFILNEYGICIARTGRFYVKIR